MSLKNSSGTIGNRGTSLNVYVFIS